MFISFYIIYKLLLHELNIWFLYTKWLYDNARCEIILASLKKEEIYRFIYKDFNELRDSIDEYVHFFNYRRPHASLNYITPSEFENTAKWRHKKGHQLLMVFRLNSNVSNFKCPIYYPHSIWLVGPQWLPFL